MHQLGGAHDGGAVHVPDRLMPETDPQHRSADRSERRHGLADDARRLGAPGSGRQQHTVGSETDRLADREPIVAVHDRVGAQLTEILHEVVDEAVVRVDHEDARHAATIPTTSDTPRRRAVTTAGTTTVQDHKRQRRRSRH